MGRPSKATREGSVYKVDRHVGVLVPMDVYDILKNMADKRKCTVSEVVRNILVEGIKEKVTEDNLDYISRIIREQLDLTMRPHVERLARLTTKAGIMSATSTILGAQAMMDLVPPEKRKVAKDAYDEARKEGVKYFRDNTYDGVNRFNE